MASAAGRRVSRASRPRIRAHQRGGGRCRRGRRPGNCRLAGQSGLKIGDPEISVNSSAAGGLRMTVHGLTLGMTARAAREAALGAGAIVELVTAGRLSDSDLDEIRSIQPNIILLAGGVDFGEKELILRNAEGLASLELNVPVLYAGNSAIRQPVRQDLRSCRDRDPAGRQRLPGRGCPQYRARPPPDSRGLQPPHHLRPGHGSPGRS